MDLKHVSLGRAYTVKTVETGDGELDKKFAAQAAEQGLINLEGTPGVGGLCASLYNFMPYEGVEKLVEFMKEFAKNNPKIQG